MAFSPLCLLLAKWEPGGHGFSLCYVVKVSLGRYPRLILCLISAFFFRWDPCDR